jgi:O-antigen/teichoic acid export membrane protein
LNQIKKLAGQTAIYGLSSILGRFLNYLLVPLHTARYIPEQYGIITEMYAYVAFLVVLLTYGMETAFFRFSSRAENSIQNVYSTTLFSIISSTTVFISLAFVFSSSIADWLHYPNHTEYVTWFAIIVGLDAAASIPLARLRAENKAKTFAAVNLINVGVNIGLNLFFVGYCAGAYQNGEHNFLIDTFYNPEIGVGYVFISNLIASIIKFLLLTPLIIKISLRLNFELLNSMMRYAIPLLIASLAGIINETLDRIMLKRMLFPELGEAGANEQVGIYGACYKVSIIITLFIQAFRYAAEPFFFSQQKEKNAPQVYAKVMNYFIVVCAVIFLGVMLYIDIIKHFLRKEEFWEGMHIVPVLMLANIFLGIYYNLSIWYKLTDKTYYGALVSILGAIITIVLNLLLIPYFGYTGSAWATLACYASMMCISYYMGKKYFPVPYNLKKFIAYIGSSLAIYFILRSIKPEEEILMYLLNSFALLLFIATVLYIEIKERKTLIT